LINELRGENDHVLLLDAGDALLNDRSPATTSKGQTSVAALNLMAYDAVAVGMKDLTLLAPDEFRERLGEAEFPMLSANAIWRDTGDLVAEPYVIKQVADHRVAILGLSEPGESDHAEARDPLQAARQWVPDLRREADVVVLLSHAGLEANREIAAQVPGIDAIVSGGGIEFGGDKRSGALVVQAEVSTPGNAGKVVGVANLRFDRAGELKQHQWERVPLGPDVAEDAEMADWLASQREAK
jgi:2',3'-cyclic-nucleotide 2'-phosphodiesterase (5'-nucleotidase family)